MEENGLMNFADLRLGKVVTKYLIFFSTAALKSYYLLKFLKQTLSNSRSKIRNDMEKLIGNDTETIKWRS